METPKKKKWAMLAAVLMSMAFAIYLISGIMKGFNTLKIVVVVMFGISAALYWYRYATEKFDEE